MEKPIVAAKFPAKVELQEGKRYSWCTCGLSEGQPFCDGSHRGTAFKPMKFKAEETKDVWFCQCKQTKNGCFCDGTHNSL